MKHILTWCCLSAMLVLGMAAGRAQVEPVAVEVYLIDTCGGCQGGAGTDCKDCKLETEAWNRYKALLQDELDAGRATLAVYNMRKLPDRYDERTERLKALGIERQDGPLPSVFVGDQLYKGDATEDESILSAVQNPAPASLSRERDLVSGGRRPYSDTIPENTVVYLHSPYCRDCKAIAPFLEDLAGDRLQKYDISTPEGLEMERQIHAQYDIPEADRIVPLVVCGSEYLAGTDQIEARLPELLATENIP